MVAGHMTFCIDIDYKHVINFMLYFFIALKVIHTIICDKFQVVGT
jgi:hypothetical protein